MAYDFNGLTQASFLTNLTNSVKRDVVTVNGYKEAQEFKLFRGERIAMLDASEDVLYIKECDDLGKYSLKVFSCKDITTKYALENTPATISKAEYESLTAKLDSLTKLLGEKHEHNAQSESPELDFSGTSVCKSTESNKSKS